MLSLITGLPGNAKTLFAIDKIINLQNELKKQGKEPRPVYYYNIELNPEHPEYNLVQDWVSITKRDLESIYLTDLQIEEGDKVLKHDIVKSGGIVIVDECQTPYPPRNAQRSVPPFVDFFAVHRHSGLDFFLITQDPVMIDKQVRRLVNQHYQLTRHGKVEASNVVFSPEKLIEECPKDLLKTSIFKFPKHLYDLYHSAEVHTQTQSLWGYVKELPLKAKIVIPVALILVIWSTYKALFSDETFTFLNPESQQEQQKQEPPKSSTPQSFGSNGFNLSSAIPDAKTEPVLYLSHLSQSGQISLAYFDLVYPDGSFISLTDVDLKNLRLDFEILRDGLYKFNGRLVTHRPANEEGSKDEK